ncbi:uncharacterized protein LOC135463815 [Liolophura sinensis]|uniref:uncharacterized protein LOC135463815 n=1 Tax=Liolophura sinensis TaxID=3198878 RepID=UPI0031582962
MGVRSKMLAIAAWRLFLLLPTVVGQSPNVTNPLVPENFTTNVKVKLTYRTAADKVGSVCGQYIDVQGSSTVIDLPAPDIERKASQVRTAPQVQFTGLDTTKLYTYLVVDQSIIIPMYGSRERPFVQELRVNVRGGDINTGVVVAPHHPVVPENITSGIHVLVYSQPAEFTNPDISDYVNTECGLGLRCDFDVLQFAMNNSLNLVFAGGFRVQEDEFSIAAIAAFNEQVACHKLWRFRAAKNPLIGDADLMIGMKAVFKTKEVVTEPLCARVFHYMDDEVYVKWNSTKAFPSRKVRALPHVYLRPMMEQTNTEGGNMEGDKMGGDKMDGDKMGGDKMEGDKMGGDKMDGDKMGGDKMGESDKPSNKSAEKKDHWFTLLLVDQTITDTNSREEPFANWVVSNIKNTDLSSGDCSVPYFPVLAPRGVAQATFLLYKQSKHIEIDPSEYAKDTPCHYQFRCNWDIRRLVKDKGLKLVGALPFQVKADPVSITHWVKEEMLKPEEGCRELAKFNHEGRMLGECLPKFDAWKALKKELDECVMEFQKKMIMEKMKNMCPELGEHFSKEMKKWGDEKKGGEMGGAMQEYGKMKDMGGKDDMKSMMDDMKKEDMEMLIKKFLMDAMDKMDKMKEAKEGDVMKPDEDMKGPHCIQVVTKYMMMMKKKMMEGDDKMDDEGDMNMEEGCKCLKAAKMFMKEHWEKYQAKKEAEKDWEKWRSWGGKGEMKDKEDEKAEWDKMMKEMWSKWEEKKDEKDDWGKGEDDDKVKKMMEELKTKMMKEFWDKMKGGEKGGDKDWESKWDSWKNWGKEVKKGEEEDKLKKMMEEMKAKMMKEFWDKMKGGEKGGDKDWESKWNTWKNWGKDEKKDGEGDKMKMMMEIMMKMKMMKEMMEKMKKAAI